MNKPDVTTEVVIKWLPDDVKTLKPEWSDEQCEDALDEIANNLIDRSIEIGWEIMEMSLPD